jgi:hypothetical protein
VNEPEAVAFAGYICRTLDRIVACLDGLDADGLNWRPPAAGANSLYAIAAHALANTEENVLGVVCGLPVRREHEAEFAIQGNSADELVDRWCGLRERLETALAALLPGTLASTRRHPRRGTLPAREVLIVAARHAAEHQGQAELTRDLLLTAAARASLPADSPSSP